MNPFRKMIKSIYKNYYRRNVMKQCETYGKGLQVNGKTKVTKHTILGNNVNFNGMSIEGGGTVKIGDYFHSGSNCHIITHVHNYDHGSEIPYDSTYINKNVTIEECVWLGEGVTM